MTSRIRKPRGRSRYRGFTVVELMVVVAILVLLIAILLPSMQKAREVTKRVVCGSNLRQINMGMLNYGLSADSLRP